MKWSEAAVRRVEEYLRAVERQLAHKPAAVRQELVAGLRDHIAESLRHVAGEGEEVGLDVVERVLAEMDSPETFAEEGAETEPAAAPVAAAARSRGAGRWFWLGVAFLLVNTYGVWKWTTRPTAPADPLPVPVAVDADHPVEKILRLRRVEQINVSQEREVLLLLAFSQMPDRNQLTRYFSLTAYGQGQVEYRLAGAAGTNTVIVETEPVLEDRLHYELSAGLPSVSGASPTDRKAKGFLDMEMNMGIKKVEAETPSFDPPLLRASFTTFPDSNGLKDYVSVEPATDYVVDAVDDWRGRGLVLRGDFKPGEIYEVVFKEGLPAANGSSLPKTLKRTVQFPLPSPAVRLDAPGRYLSPRGTLSIPVQAANLEEYDVRLRPVFANNLVQLALRESTGHRYYGRLTADLTGAQRVTTNALPASRDRLPVRGAIDLRALADDEPRGVYWLEVEGQEASGDQRLIVVTDLGIAARVFPGGALVWVNSLRTAEPAAGAAVTVVARNNQVLARGTADERGLVQLDLPMGEEMEPFLVTAEKDGDLSYIDLSRTRVEQGEGLYGVPYLEAGQMEAAVFGDRGVYRPGETAFIQTLVRDGQMRAPEPFPALLRVRRPDGRIFRDVPVELDAYGSAKAEVELPDYLPTGRYQLELAMPGTFTVLGSTSVALEDFVPPQIRVAVESATERGSAGDLFAFGVRSSHLFGRAASGLKVSGAATFKAAPFAPTNWPGWTFGDADKPFESVYRNLGVQTLDADGFAEFEAESRVAWRPAAALQMVQQATVMEASGRSVTAYGSVQLDAYPFYIGLKPAWEGAVRAGETQRVAVVEVLPDGSSAGEGKPLVLTLSRVTWNSVLRRNSNGRYEWKSERQVVAIREDTLAAGGEMREWAFAVDVAGNYMLAAVDPASGASSRLSFYAGSAEQEWSAWSREKPGRVELVWDQERYRPRRDCAPASARAVCGHRAVHGGDGPRARVARAGVEKEYRRNRGGRGCRLGSERLLHADADPARAGGGGLERAPRHRRDRASGPVSGFCLAGAARSAGPGASAGAACGHRDRARRGWKSGSRRRDGDGGG